MCQHTGTWELCSACYARALRVQSPRRWGTGAGAAPRRDSYAASALRSPRWAACPHCAKKCRGQEGARAHVAAKHDRAEPTASVVSASAIGRTVLPTRHAETPTSPFQPAAPVAAPKTREPDPPPPTLGCPKCGKRLRWGWASEHPCLRPSLGRGSPQVGALPKHASTGYLSRAKPIVGAKSAIAGTPAAGEKSRHALSHALRGAVRHRKCADCGSLLNAKNVERHGLRCGKKVASRPIVKPALKSVIAPKRAHHAVAFLMKQPSPRPSSPDSASEAYTERVRRARLTPTGNRKCRQCSAPAMDSGDCCYAHNPE
jgi:hypothetical protein